MGYMIDSMDPSTSRITIALPVLKSFLLSIGNKEV